MRIIAAALLLIVSAVMAGSLHGEKAGQGFTTVPVVRGSVSTVTKATGVVNPVLMVEVGSQLSGQIAEVLVDFNERVKAGQVIARVNPETYVAAVNQAKAALKIAKATAELQKAALAKAKVATENARTARKGAEADVAAAQAKQEEAERDVQRNVTLSRNSAISNRELTQSFTIRDSGAAGVASLNAQLKMKGEAIAIAD